MVSMTVEAVADVDKIEATCGSPAPKRSSSEESDGSGTKRRKMHDDEDSDSVFGLTSLRSCTWGWDSDGELIDSLSLGPDCSDPLGLAGAEPRRTEAETVGSPCVPARPVDARKVEWYTSERLLDHLTAHEQDSCTLTRMLHDTFRHEIHRLALNNPAYHPKMGYIDLIEPCCQYVVLRLHSRVVATASVHPRHAGLQDFTLITNLMVHRDVRGQGLGTFLLDTIHGQVLASAAGQMVGMLLPTILPVEQMDFTAPRCLDWLGQQGYRLQSWDSTNPFAQCTLLQMALDGLPHRDYYFLFRDPPGPSSGVPWQHRINDGSLLQQFRVLKQRVLLGCHSGMQERLQLSA